MHISKYLFQFSHRLFVAYQIEQRLRQIFRCSIVLQQFRHDKFLGNNIGQADIRLVFLAFQQPPGEGWHLVGNHHRALEQCGFQRGGAGCHEHAVSRDHRVVCMAE